MQPHYLLHNNDFFLATDKLLTAQNRGFRYGDGLFESMKMFGGKLQFAEKHADRLAAGMNALKMEQLRDISDAVLRTESSWMCMMMKKKASGL